MGHIEKSGRGRQCWMGCWAHGRDQRLRYSLETRGSSRDWSGEDSEHPVNEILSLMALKEIQAKRASEPPVGPKNLDIPCSD
jgi:hypothetical protein